MNGGATAAVKGTERFKSAIPGKKVVVEVFDLQKAKQRVNDMINALNLKYLDRKRNGTLYAGSLCR